MGFEFMFVTMLPTPAQWQEILVCFERNATYHRVPANSGATSIAYAYEQTPRVNWPEDFMVSVETQGIYLLFHSGVRQNTIEHLTSCLLANGLSESFEEL